MFKIPYLKIFYFPTLSPLGTRVIDATGKYVLPGGIDANVHLETPFVEGNTRTIDDFYQGTRAAIAGGTTTVSICHLSFNMMSIPIFLVL